MAWARAARRRRQLSRRVRGHAEGRQQDSGGHKFRVVHRQSFDRHLADRGQTFENAPVDGRPAEVRLPIVGSRMKKADDLSRFRSVTTDVSPLMAVTFWASEGEVVQIVGPAAGPRYDVIDRKGRDLPPHGVMTVFAP